MNPRVTAALVAVALLLLFAALLLAGYDLIRTF